MNNMTFRKANHNDIPFLVQMRNLLLMEERASPVSSIDEELTAYFTNGFSDGSFNN